MNIHEIVLSREGQRRVRDLQEAHAVMLAAARGPALWAMPRCELLIAQADRFELPDAYVRERRAHDVTVPAGSVRMSLIAHSVERHKSAERVLSGDEAAAWLTRKLDGVIAIDELSVEDMGDRRGKRQGMPLTLRWTAFYATGEVLDRGRLETLMRDGVGRAKAYGCGLLLAVSA